MIKIIKAPTRIMTPDGDNKIIEEFVGNVNTKSSDISIAKMKAIEGWSEPGQTPEFDEYTFVLYGIVKVETMSEKYDVKAGEIIISPKNEWIRYSTPFEGGAEYISICLPAFSPDSVKRDE
jgi:ethanolamine utilization protein EutQ (cupin superfamily)